MSVLVAQCSVSLACHGEKPKPTGFLRLWEGCGGRSCHETPEESNMNGTLVVGCSMIDLVWVVIKANGLFRY